MSSDWSSQRFQSYHKTMDGYPNWWFEWTSMKDIKPGDVIFHESLNFKGFSLVVEKSENKQGDCPPILTVFNIQESHIFYLTSAMILVAKWKQNV